MSARTTSQCPPPARRRYGSGGKKRGDKRNDKASAAQSYKDFNHGNRSASGAPAGRRGKGVRRVAYSVLPRARVHADLPVLRTRPREQKANRPGKRRRLAARAGRS